MSNHANNHPQTESNMFLQNISSINQTTMSSREIAELTGKRHEHVRRDVRKVCEKLGLDTVKMERKYKDSMNRLQVEFVIGGSALTLLMAGYMGKSFSAHMQEKAALATIEQVLQIKLIKQYRVGKYRIDGYDAQNNIAYEIDECHHKNPKNKRLDMERQAFIEKKLGCKFIRIKV